MGCSCSSKVISRTTKKQPSLEGMKSEKLESLQIGVGLYTEFINGNINILVWGNESEIQVLFPKKNFTFNIALNTTVTFNITPYIPNSELIVDCLVLISNNRADYSKILDINKEYSQVCIKLLISANDLFQFPSEQLNTIKSGELFYTELFEQMKNIEKNLRRIFEELDKDKDGLIDASELILGLDELGFKVESGKTEQYFREIDLNHDGKISFREFAYWWKRGRQGGKSFKKMIEKWSSAIFQVLPEIGTYFEKSLINKNKSKKSGKIEVGLYQECQFGVSLFLGTGIKREEILRSVVSLLGLFIYENWVVVKVTYRSEAMAKFNLQKVEEMIQSVKLLLLAKINIGNEIENGVNTRVVVAGCDLFVSVVFDIHNEALEPILEVVDKLEKLLKSPTDDFFDCKIASTKSFVEIDEEKPFLESLGNGYVLINSEHWEVYQKILRPKSENEILLQKFLEVEGEFAVKDSGTGELKSLKYYVKRVLGGLVECSKAHPACKVLLTSFNGELVPELEVYARFSSLGLRLSLTDTTLSALFR